MRTPRATLTLRWLAALAGAAYVGTVMALGSQLVADNHWDTDVSGPLTLAERLRGSGPVYIPHYGEWTNFWWLLATRALPWHEQIWTASGYALTLLGAVLLGWVTWSVAGRWAGITAAAAALVVGPFVLRSFLSTTGAHVTNPFCAIVLAGALVLLSRTTSWVPAVAAGLFAGVNAASDGLLWIAGIAPFALAAALLVAMTRRMDIARRAGATVGIAVVTTFATNAVMRALDFQLESVNVSLAPVHEWPGNVMHLGRMLALLGGANYALPGPYPREPLRGAIALLTFAAVAAPIAAAVKTRRSNAMLRAYAVYWASAVVLLSVAFVVTPNAAALGPKSVNYLLALAPAAGVGIGLLAARSPRAQLAVAAAVALVAAVNIAGILAGRAETVDALREQAPKIERLLERKGVTRGFAGFWDASNLTWQTNERLLVSPVGNCGTELCANKFFTIRSWYQRKGGPTFLLVDSANAFIVAPSFVSTADATYRFGQLTLYLFAYDITTHIRVTPPS